MRRNKIRSIEVDGVMVTNHYGKVQALNDHFKTIIGTEGSSVWQFDCQALYQGSPAATEDQGQTGLAQASILQPGKRSRIASCASWMPFTEKKCNWKG